MITEFNEYKDLPFSESIQNELFIKHTHANLVFEDDPDAIVYKERDVLILLQMMQGEYDQMISYIMHGKK